MQQDRDVLSPIDMLRMLSPSLLVALTVVTWGSAALLGQADTTNSGEFSVYGGGAFGIGSHPAVGEGLRS